MTGPRDRIVFLVGAGLVHDAGLPMSVSLAKSLKDSLKELSDSEDAPPKDANEARQFLSALYFLIGGIRFQEGYCNRDPDAPINIEQVAVAALELRGRLANPLAPYASGWHQRVIELENDDPTLLSRFIDFIYGRLSEWLSNYNDADIAYLNRLSDFINLNQAVDIFSLNYDLCIESAFGSAGIENFKTGFTKDGWSSEELLSDADIRLYKLHGSLDWVEDSAFGLCSTKFPRFKNAEDIEGDQKPLLIFGTSHKLSARQPFLTLAYHFSRAVQAAKILVIIGYSFSDDYINEIIEQSILTNPDLRIVLVAPDSQQISKRNHLLNDNPRVTQIQLGAKTALNDGHLLRAVRKLQEELRSDSPF